MKADTAALHPPEGLQTEILRGAQAFAVLRADWQAAVARMPRPSLFITPEFLALAWQHLSSPDDEPWFVTVRQHGALVGLLPLTLTRQRYFGLSFKTLMHMGVPIGERPGVLHLIGADRIWQLALQALVAARAGWQALDLREIDEGAWPLSDAAAQALRRQHGLKSSRRFNNHWASRRTEGTWDDHLAGQADPGWRLEVIDNPAGIAPAFDRYLALEAKGSAKDSAWYDPRQAVFHRALLPQLAATRQASVWLLVAGGQDVAALVRLQQGGIVYERLCAADPAHAPDQPETALRLLALKASFGRDAQESHVMGSSVPIQDRPEIHPLYPDTHRTFSLMVWNPPLRHKPLLWLRQGLKALRGSLRGLTGGAWAAAPSD